MILEFGDIRETAKAGLNETNIIAQRIAELLRSPILVFSGRGKGGALLSRHITPTLPVFFINPYGEILLDDCSSENVTAMISGYHRELCNRITNYNIITWDKKNEMKTKNLENSGGTFLDFAIEMACRKATIYLIGIDFDDNQDRSTDAIGINRAIKKGAKTKEITFYQVSKNKKIKGNMLNIHEAALKHSHVFRFNEIRK